MGPVSPGNEWDNPRTPMASHIRAEYYAGPTVGSSYFQLPSAAMMRVEAGSSTRLALARG
jgi:hypothetical protein